MKLHNPFRVAFRNENFPLFMCAMIVALTSVVLVIILINQFMTLNHVISLGAVGALARVIYAVFKGK